MLKPKKFISLIIWLSFLITSVQTSPILKSEENNNSSSINTEIKITKVDKETHRYSLKELEPDLATSIFNNGFVKNPLSRTTKIPLSFQSDVGNTKNIALTAPRKRRAIGLNIGNPVNHNEYDSLTEDFLIDAEPIFIATQNDEEIIKEEKGNFPLWKKTIEIPSRNLHYNIEESDDENLKKNQKSSSAENFFNDEVIFIVKIKFKNLIESLT